MRTNEGTTGRSTLPRATTVEETEPFMVDFSSDWPIFSGEHLADKPGRLWTQEVATGPKMVKILLATSGQFQLAADTQTN